MQKIRELLTGKYKSAVLIVLFPIVAAIVCVVIVVAFIFRVSFAAWAEEVQYNDPEG